MNTLSTKIQVEAGTTSFVSMTEQDYNLLRETAQQAVIDEATLSAIVFGDDHTAGKTWRDIAARVREYQAHIIELVAVCQQLSTTAVCQACGTRISNTQDSRLEHVAHCDQRPQDNPLAAQLIEIGHILSRFSGATTIDKARRALLMLEQCDADRLSE